MPVRRHLLLPGMLVVLGLTALTACSSTSTISNPYAKATPIEPSVRIATSAPAPTSSSAQTDVVRATVPDYQPIPYERSLAVRRGLDFGILTRVTETNGVVTLQFDRAEYYDGKQAIAHNGGKPVDDDYLIVNTNPMVRSFTLDPKASIRAVNDLRINTDSSGDETLTVAQFVHNDQTWDATTKLGVPVWIRHTDGLTGPVTALTEQFVP